LKSQELFPGRSREQRGPGSARKLTDPLLLRCTTGEGAGQGLMADALRAFGAARALHGWYDAGVERDLKKGQKFTQSLTHFYIHRM